MIWRGDVVMVDFPFTDTGQSKVRPALVVQNDRDNQKIRKTVIAMITVNGSRLFCGQYIIGAISAGEDTPDRNRFPQLCVGLSMKRLPP